MLKPEKKKSYKRIALVLSLCTLILWGVLGTGASLAWFTDTSEEVINIFNIAEFDLEVSYRNDEGEWENIEGTTQIFDEEALYEPGYVQVVYLKVENKGDCAFDFKTAVTVNGYTLASNVYGQTFNLQEYLRFGLVIADTESEMDQNVASRDEALRVAERKLSHYATDVAELEAGDAEYIAVVVAMPKTVGNEANYRGSSIPTVDLGISVTADQIRE